MKDISSIVLDDLKMNLIASLIVLLLSANFTNTVELPFKLAETKKKEVGAGLGHIKSTEIRVWKEGEALMISFGQKKRPIIETETVLSSINPALPVSVLVQNQSGITYEQLITVLSVLKSKGAGNVSLMAEAY